jgi:hypothetical protein
VVPLAVASHLNGHSEPTHKPEDGRHKTGTTTTISLLIAKEWELPTAYERLISTPYYSRWRPCTDPKDAMLLGQQQENGVGTAPLAWRPAERRDAGCPVKLEEESSFRSYLVQICSSSVD